MIGAFFCMLFTCVGVFLSVAFFTLLERKGLGYFQIRKGPNKVGLAGIPQPLADAVKLFSKEMVAPGHVNQFPYFCAPVFSLILALLLWELYPLSSVSVVCTWGLLFFLCVSALNVYGVLLAGWSSNSKYSLLGAVRAAAQTISYEVSMALVLVSVLFLSWSFDFMEIKLVQGTMWFMFMFFPLFAVWFVTCFAETNRAPFDFAEGESELVSGFNVEYSAVGFALIFMAEYANILVMSLFSSVVFMGGASGDLLRADLGDIGFSGGPDIMLVLSTVGLAFVFIWARASFPRYRYDLLMQLTWKGFLPFVLGALCFVVGGFFLGGCIW
nr:NADH dehydrogenase subunit 1 [Puncturella cf. parvinobilis]